MSGVIMLRSDSKDRSGVRSHPRQKMRRPALREIPRMALLIPHPCEEGLPKECRAAQGFCRGRA